MVARTSQTGERVCFVDRSVPMDPLLAALIGKLPPAAGGWHRSERAAWLRLMAMAFDVVYGAEEAIDVPSFLSDTPGPTPRSEDHAPRAPARPAAPPQRPPHTVNGQDFYVDKDGFARCDYQFMDGVPVPDPGRRVLASEAAEAEAIYDYRGTARDRSTIVWADDSVGAIAGMNFCGPG